MANGRLVGIAGALTEGVDGATLLASPCVIVDAQLSGRWSAVKEGAMPKVTSLGHIGLHCNDFPTMLDFYTRVLGFTVTDRFPPEREACFLSARPAEEHHELLLTSGRTAPDDAKLLQQLSMHVDSLEDLKAFHRLFQDEGVKEERIITHGNTASIYFRDPENNYLEVYYSIPVDFPQPFGAPIDLELDDDALLQQIADLRAASGKV